MSAHQGGNGVDPEEMTPHQLAVANYKFARANYDHGGQIYQQYGSVIRELSRIAGSLEETVVELRRISRGRSPSTRPPPPTPATPAARERLQSYMDVEEMSRKVETIVDMDVGDEENTKTHKLRTVRSTAQELAAMLEERRHKELARIEARELWTFRFKVVGAIGAGIPIVGGIVYVSVLIFRVLYTLAFKQPSP